MEEGITNHHFKIRVLPTHIQIIQNGWIIQNMGLDIEKAKRTVKRYCDMLMRETGQCPTVEVVDVQDKV
jgi:hypothetical protein